MLAFIIGTLFGLIIGMVLNHAIEEAERKSLEAQRLRKVINQITVVNNNTKGGNDDAR